MVERRFGAPTQVVAPTGRFAAPIAVRQPEERKFGASPEQIRARQIARQLQEQREKTPAQIEAEKQAAKEKFIAQEVEKIVSQRKDLESELNRIENEGRARGYFTPSEEARINDLAGRIQAAKKSESEIAAGRLTFEQAQRFIIASGEARASTLPSEVQAEAELRSKFERGELTQKEFETQFGERFGRLPLITRTEEIEQTFLDPVLAREFIAVSDEGVQVADARAKGEVFLGATVGEEAGTLQSRIIGEEQGIPITEVIFVSKTGAIRKATPEERELFIRETTRVEAVAEPEGFLERLEASIFARRREIISEQVQEVRLDEPRIREQIEQFGLGAAANIISTGIFFKQLFTDPIGTTKGIFTSAKLFVTSPRVRAEFGEEITRAITLEPAFVSGFVVAEVGTDIAVSKAVSGVTSAIKGTAKPKFKITKIAKVTPDDVAAIRKATDIVEDVPSKRLRELSVKKVLEADGIPEAPIRVLDTKKTPLVDFDVDTTTLRRQVSRLRSEADVIKIEKGRAGLPEVRVRPAEAPEVLKRFPLERKPTPIEVDVDTIGLRRQIARLRSEADIISIEKGKAGLPEVRIRPAEAPEVLQKFPVEKRVAPLEFDIDATDLRRQISRLRTEADIIKVEKGRGGLPEVRVRPAEAPEVLQRFPVERRVAPVEFDVDLTDLRKQFSRLRTEADIIKVEKGRKGLPEVRVRPAEAPEVLQRFPVERRVAPVEFDVDLTDLRKQFSRLRTEADIIKVEKGRKGLPEVRVRPAEAPEVLERFPVRRKVPEIQDLAIQRLREQEALALSKNVEEVRSILKERPSPRVKTAKDLFQEPEVPKGARAVVDERTGLVQIVETKQIRKVKKKVRAKPRLFDLDVDLVKERVSVRRRLKGQIQAQKVGELDLPTQVLKAIEREEELQVAISPKRLRQKVVQTEAIAILEKEAVTPDQKIIPKAVPAEEIAESLKLIPATALAEAPAEAQAPFLKELKLPKLIPTPDVKKKPKKIIQKRKKEIRKKVPTKVEQGYDVFVKPAKLKGEKQIKSKKANLVPLSKDKAERLRDYIIDQTLSRQGRIKPTKKTAEEPQIKVPKTDEKRFRDFKQVKGERKKLPQGQVIEKAKFSLSQRREKKGIRAAKLIADLRGTARIKKKTLKRAKPLITKRRRSLTQLANEL